MTHTTPLNKPAALHALAVDMRSRAYTITNATTPTRGAPPRQPQEPPMPDITTNTPREQYTISGKTFNIYQPYSAGHVLTANEAASMNQTFAENVRNNFAKRVKEATEAGGFDQDVFQGSLDDYMSDYEFGQRSGGGGRTSDPVEAEALRISKDKVRGALSKKGIKVSDVAASEITRLAKEVLDKNPAIRETARAIVEAASDIDIGEVGDVQANDEAAPAAKGKKAAA